MKAKAIYVEIPIRSEVAKVWPLTQTPSLHQQWDLRFSFIDYLPRADSEETQRFIYCTRIGFGLAISGYGETVGSGNTAGGEMASALRFWSDDPKSLIRVGSGYWKYIPTASGTKFLTRYEYETRYGAAGRLFDAIVFRPLLGWATAWSFDRLRLWADKGISPTVSLERTLIHYIVRLTLFSVWIYQGLVPKLLFRNSGELEILRGSGLLTGWESLVLSLIGVLEILFGFAFIIKWRSSIVYKVNIVALILLTVGAAISQPNLFVQPFGPLPLNLCLVGLSLAGIVVSKDLPTATKCHRRPGQENGINL